ncbi:MAG TPA: hypothetical protein VMH87_05120 [Pseudomonadales bacterium]|nr:hypothetical protein [Pseudomonadales bacterium]
MSFIKKNYEKILLGAVLLGLVVSLLLGQAIVQHDKDTLQQTMSSLIKRTPKPLDALDMSREDASFNRVQSSYQLDFETTNRLFNTMQWQRAANGRIIKISNGTEVGPRAVKVTGIKPLNFVLKFETFEPASQLSPARYQVTVEHGGAVNPLERRPKKHFIALGEKEQALSLVAVNGPANNPVLTIQILETGEKITVTMDKPFQEVESYEADLTYPPENKHWNNQRVGAALKFYNNNYNIVVIDQNEVVISAESNQKRTTLSYQP